MQVDSKVLQLRPRKVQNRVMIADPPSTTELVRSYLTAKREVVGDGFAYEIAWQAAAGSANLSAEEFVREAAWVVLSSGMRESVVRGLFGRLASEMYDFDLAAMSANQSTVRAASLAVFGHEGKIDAILHIAAVARQTGEQGLRELLSSDPQSFLESLPFIGPVTWRHLAKNLGVRVAKPDRHLVRLAHATSRSSVDALCDEIAGWVGEPVPVVDVVLWRWSVLHARGCLQPCDVLLHRRT